MTNAPGPRSPQAADPAPVLAMRDVSIRFATGSGHVHAVTGLSLTIDQSEVFALVGESGSGKSVTALSVMGLLPPTSTEISGSIALDGRELTGLKTREYKQIRGRDVGMVFQDPMSSLNPVHRIGKQIGESLRLHEGVSRAAALRRAIDLLERVGIPDPARRAKDYPHEFSGGMRQRVVIAMALAGNPKLLIADEPTTALDVTVQRQIVDLVQELQRERNMAVLWITHDLGVVAEIADRVAVMYAGRVLETGTAREVYAHTRHPYTSGLLRSIPRLGGEVDDRLAEIPGAPRVVNVPLTACAFHDRCPLGGEGCVSTLPDLAPTDRPDHLSACIHHEVLVADGITWAEGGQPPPAAAISDRDRVPVAVLEDVQVHFPARRGDAGAVRAVDGVDLDLDRGRTLGLVGESGCGKTTVGRSMVGLVELTGGSMELLGAPLDRRNRVQRRAVQMIFQDPFSSMNPGMRIRDVIAEPMRIHRLYSGADLEARVGDLLVQVGLSADLADRHPHEFSGGQRQRIAIARALAAEPEVIVCDEPVSALDVSVQAQIVNLLRDIQLREGVALLFIAHDLAVVRHISHEVAVMYLGRIVERAPRDTLYEHPLHPYTRALLDAVPVPDPTAGRTGRPLVGDLPSPADPPSGCRFHTRCPVAIEGVCSEIPPVLQKASADQWVACHLVHDPGSTGDPDSKQPSITQWEGATQ